MTRANAARGSATRIRVRPLGNSSVTRRQPAVEAPAVRVAFTGKPPELCDVLLGIVFASDRLEVVANHLIETLAESFGLLAGASDELVFER